MLYFHVDPTMGHRSGFQVTYTTIRSISEWFTFMWILNWVKNLNLKSHIQQLQAFRNALPSCGSFYGSWIWIQSYIYNNVFLVLVAHWPHTSPRFKELKWTIDLCCILAWVTLLLLLLRYPCFSSKIRYWEWMASHTSSEYLSKLSLVISKCST